MTTSTKRTARKVDDSTKSLSSEVRTKRARKAAQTVQPAIGEKVRVKAAPPEGPPAKLATLTVKRNAALGTLVTRINKVYGVKVAGKPKPVNTPLPTSRDDALEIARRVGLITNNGKLASIFK